MTMIARAEKPAMVPMSVYRLFGVVAECRSASFLEPGSDDDCSMLGGVDVVGKKRSPGGSGVSVP
jgi:hypothetical protein